MTVLVDRNVTVANFLSRMERVPAITGHPWESVAGYGLTELLTLEAMLRAEVAHLNAGLGNNTLMIPRAVAGARKRLLDDQLSSVRAVRRIRFPRGTVMNAAGTPKPLYKWANHLARMFHVWMQTNDEADWEAVLAAYEKIPVAALTFTRREEEDAGCD